MVPGPVLPPEPVLGPAPLIAIRVQTGRDGQLEAVQDAGDSIVLSVEIEKSVDYVHDRGDSNPLTSMLSTTQPKA